MDVLTMNIADRRELFLDDALVERTTGEVLRVFHEPVPREWVLTLDKPWEGNGSGYGTVFQDGGLYRMYYCASHYLIEQGELRYPHPGERTAYAESRDGIHWERPPLGLIAFEGSRENNLVIDQAAGRGHAGSGSFIAFADTRPDVVPDARYKGLGVGADHRGQDIGGGHGLYAWQSADGVHWRKMQDGPVYDKRHRGLGDVSARDVLTWLDSQNTAFWSPLEQRYVMYYRVYTYDGRLQTPDWVFPEDYYERRVRQIEKAVSDDFLHWERVGLIACDGNCPSIEQQFYTNVIRPYHRAPHVYIGMPGRYGDRGWTPALEQLPDLERRTLESRVELRSGTALTDTLLMWSRDGLSFSRAPDAFLRPGPERPGSWMYGDHWAAWHLVETASGLEGSGSELSLFVQEFGRTAEATRVRRYTLRLDGFASLRAPLAGGEVVTRPLTFTGRRLRLNFATSAAGAVRVEVQDVSGKPVPGFALEDSVSLYGDTVARAAGWAEDPDLGALAGRRVRLRFVLNEADLYAFKFG